MIRATPVRWAAKAWGRKHDSPQGRKCSFTARRVHDGPQTRRAGETTLRKHGSQSAAWRSGSLSFSEVVVSNLRWRVVECIDDAPEHHTRPVRRVSASMTPPQATRLHDGTMARNGVELWNRNAVGREVVSPCRRVAVEPPRQQGADTEERVHVPACLRAPANTTTRKHDLRRVASQCAG